MKLRKFSTWEAGFVGSTWGVTRNRTNSRDDPESLPTDCSRHDTPNCRKDRTDSYAVTNVEAAWQRGRTGLIGEGHFGTYDGYDNAYSVSTTGRFLLTPGAYQKYNKANGCFSGIASRQYALHRLRKMDLSRGGGVWESPHSGRGPILTCSATVWGQIFSAECTSIRSHSTGTGIRRPAGDLIGSTPNQSPAPAEPTKLLESQHARMSGSDCF